MEQIRTKVENLLHALGRGVYEREEVLALSFLSAAAGESIFLLGLPGVAKSMIARRLGLAFRDARRFEYLMSRFSTPDEIFGPVSITKLKDGDTYERVVDGYLPSADVIFLDEIWKAGPAIQNSLLTALNEKIFHNGSKDIRLPLKCILAASNELPAEGEGLEALWDRFLFRYIVNPLSSKQNFFSLIAGCTVSEVSIPEEMQFSSDELDDLLSRRDTVEIPPSILEFIYAIRKRYAARAIEQLKERAEAGPKDSGDEFEDEEASYPYVSDRRWKKIAGILRSCALLNGRAIVNWSDCLLLEHLIWDKDIQIDMIRQDIANELIKTALTPAMSSSAAPGVWTGDPKGTAPEYWVSEDGKYYGFEAGGEMMYISNEEYDSLACDRKYSGKFVNGNVISVNIAGPGQGSDFFLRKPKAGTIVINNFSYPLKLKRPGGMPGSGYFLEELVRSSASVIADLAEMVANNLFTRSLKEYPELSREIRRYQGNFGK